MKCSVCKIRMEKTAQTLILSVDNRHIDITGVPARVCPSCGRVCVDDYAAAACSQYAGQIDGDTLCYDEIISVQNEEYTVLNTLFGMMWNGD